MTPEERAELSRVIDCPDRDRLGEHRCERERNAERLVEGMLAQHVESAVRDERVRTAEALHDALAAAKRKAWDAGARCRAAHPPEVSVRLLNPHVPQQEAVDW